MGTGTPKQFIKVMGKPVIAYTLEKYQRNANIDAIEIVCADAHLEEMRAIVSRYGIDKARWYASGGETFQISAMNGIFQLKGKASDEDIVLLIYGVSPMVTDEIIDDAIRVCRLHGNAFPADETVMPSCVRDDACSSVQFVERDTIVGLNCPWAFRFGEVLEAYETALAEGYLSQIEPHTSSLYLHQGKRIWFSKSSSSHIKITRKEDLDLFEGYLLLQEKRKNYSSYADTQRV